MIMFWPIATTDVRKTRVKHDPRGHSIAKLVNRCQYFDICVDRTTSWLYTKVIDEN